MFLATPRGQPTRGQIQLVADSIGKRGSQKTCRSTTCNWLYIQQNRRAMKLKVTLSDQRQWSDGSLGGPIVLALLPNLPLAADD
jgi:hypothetical protein